MSDFKEQLDEIAEEWGIRPSTHRRLLVCELIRRFKVAEEALNKIASWDEGEEVNGTFDCPSHAEAARETFAELQKEWKEV